jgi:hypothetical protein
MAACRPLRQLKWIVIVATRFELLQMVLQPRARGYGTRIERVGRMKNES